MEDIEKTLNDREQIHGGWAENSKIAQELKVICYENSVQRPAYMNEGLNAICSKLARIVCGNPMEPDHWHDIQGYARLVEKELLIHKMPGLGACHKGKPSNMSLRQEEK